MRNAAVRRLFELARNDKNLVIISGDLGYNVLTEFSERSPDQFINAGLSEQNMTAVAAGLAYEGKTVFTYSIGNFATLRCLEQIRNNVAYHDVNVNIIAIGGGFAYGDLGMTHHATEDLAILRALPRMAVFSPADPVEAEEVVSAAYRLEHPTYIRLGKTGEPQIHQSISEFEVGKSIKVRDGQKICIFATGSILSEALKALNELHNDGVHPAIFSFPTIKPIDEIAIRDHASSCDLIITLEEHTIVGGLGGAVSEIVAEMPGNKAVVKRIGLNDEFTSIVGDQSFLRRYYGLSSGRVVKVVRQFLDMQKNEKYYREDNERF